MPTPPPNQTATLLYNLEAEEAVIASLLINPDEYPVIKDALHTRDIHDERIRWIWESFGDLYNRGIAIDMVVLANDLDKRGLLEEIGGQAYITGILARYPTWTSSANIRGYIDIIVDYARRRQWVERANEIARMSFDTTVPAEGIPVKIHNMLAEADAAQTSTAQTPAEIAALTLMEIIDDNRLAALQTHIPLLDKQLGGFPLGETVLLIGDSTVGKTALALQIAEQVALSKHRVLYVSTESLAHTMVARRVCGRCGIAQKQLRAKNLTDEQKDRLKQAAAKYQEQYAGTLIFDDQAKNPDAIRRAVAKIRPALIVVDHLDELATGNGDNRTLELLAMMDQLKSISKEYGASNLIIHTISAGDNDGELSENEVPSYHNLSWAKGLRYKTDIMLGLYPSKVAMPDQDMYLRYLWVLKDREGSRFARVNLRFDAVRQWFTDTPFSR